MALDSAVRVLIADADPVLRKQLRGRLLSEGIHSDVVADAKSAVKTLTALPYAVVLVDLQLPHAGAEEILRAIGGLDLPQRPVVLVFASAMIACSLDVQVVQIVLRKPLDLAQLADIVQGCVMACAPSSEVSPVAGRPPDPAEPARLTPPLA